MGIEIKYTKELDQRLGDYDKNHQRALRNQGHDNADTTSGATEGLVKKGDGTGYYTAEQTKRFKERMQKKKAYEKAETAGTVVCAGGTDTVTDKEKDAAIKKNIDKQTKSEGGSVQRAAGGLSRFAQTEEDRFGSSEVSTSVDAETAVNNVNSSNLEGYFQSVINTILSPLDRVSADGSVCKCISVARRGCDNIQVNIGTVRAATICDVNHIVPDSGETSHMLCSRSDFEDDYV